MFNTFFSHLSLAHILIICITQIYFNIIFKPVICQNIYIILLHKTVFIISELHVLHVITSVELFALEFHSWMTIFKLQKQAIQDLLNTSASKMI